MFTCQVPNSLNAKCSSCMIDLGFCAKQSGCCILQKQPTTTKAGLAVGAIGLAAVALFQEAEIVGEVQQLATLHSSGCCLPRTGKRDSLRSSESLCSCHQSAVHWQPVCGLSSSYMQSGPSSLLRCTGCLCVGCRRVSTLIRPALMPLAKHDGYQ